MMTENWRVGGPERRFVISSIHAMIAENVAQYADELSAIGEDPTEAGLQTSEFWREMIDDAVRVGMSRVLS